MTACRQLPGNTGSPTETAQGLTGPAGRRGPAATAGGASVAFSVRWRQVSGAVTHSRIVT